MTTWNIHETLERASGIYPALQLKHKEMPVLRVKFLGEASVKHEDELPFGNSEIKGPLDHPGGICTWRYGSNGSNAISYLY